MSEHLSDLALDALRIQGGEDAHLVSCARCQARREALDTDAAAFVRRFSLPGLAADAIAQSEKKPRRTWLFVPAILTAAAAMFLVFRPGTIRTKGPGGVEVYVLDGDDKQRMGGPVDANARLAIRVSVETARHVRLLWESTPGDFGALYPSVDARAWVLEAPTWLHREVVLDGALGPERLGVVSCEGAIDHPAAAALLRGDSREDCVVEWISILKR